MRAGAVLVAVAVVLLGTGPAWAQQKSKAKSKKSGPSAPLAGRAPDVQTDPARDGERAIFREWAKTIRETADASKRLNKKQAERDAWAVRSAMAKEEKLRARYRLSQYKLFLIIKRGVAEKWPTDKPEDLAVVRPIVAKRQEYLDAMIFEEELDAWVLAHTPSNTGRMRDLLDFANEQFASGFKEAELRKRAPINPCMAKLPDERVCLRKVVGPPGRKCYEHRDPEKDSPK